MNVLKTIRNYYFYCGIEKDEYDALKKDAYISNFKVWKILHILMAAVFCLLLLFSLSSSIMEGNRLFYLIAFLYSAAAVLLFHILKQDSIAAQLIIYLSMSMLFLFGCLISLNSPQFTATTFIVMLLITPMFMIDRPVHMTVELVVASAVFLIWTRHVKPYDVWQIDCGNVVTYSVVGIFLNVIANSIRLKEFVLTRQISIQKDTDDMTGLRNKGALTREINAFLAEGTTGKGLMFILDVDRFKSINDVYGHVVGDSVITQIGRYLGGRFTQGEVAGRFGGDEFIVFIQDTDETENACKIAEEMVESVARTVTLPDAGEKVSVSVGVAVYRGQEKNYSEILNKADLALYAAKADPIKRYSVYEQTKR